jgi:MFS family permease
MLFFLTQFMQNILGYSPLEAGLAFLPITVGVVLGAQSASRLIGRLGPRPLMSFGALVGAVGLFGLSRVTDHSGYVSGVLGPVLGLSFGLGLIFVSTTIVAVAGVSPRESGLSSALLNVGQQLGGSLGIAVLGTIAATVTRNQLANRIPTHALINQAFTDGYRSAFAISAVIALVGFGVAAIVIKGRPQPTEVAGVPEAA